MFFSRSFRSGVAAGFLCCLSFACGAASPPEVTLKDFRTRVHEWFAQHAGESSLELLRNESASAELNDLLWQLQELVNQGAPLTGFEDVGIHAQEDGRSVSFELERFPEWKSFERRVPVLATPDGFRSLVPRFKAHGLSTEDVQALTGYLSNNDLQSRKFGLFKSLSAEYSKIVNADERQARELAEAYAYDYSHKSYEIDHAWALSLLDHLDVRGQRAIASSFAETVRDGSSMGMGSDGDVDQMAGKMIEMFRSAQYQAYMRAEAAKYARPRSLDFSLEPGTAVEEAQDPAWSYDMQKKLERFFADHALADRFNVISVDCRTTYCEIKAEGKAEDESTRAFSQAALEITQLGWGLLIESGGSGSNRDGTLYEMHEVFRRDPGE